MNWEAIGAVGEVGGALLVGVTLICLALQIRQNTRMMRATIRQGRLDQINQRVMRIATSKELATVITKHDIDEKLDAAETEQLFNYLMSVLRYHETVFPQRVDRLLEDTTAEPQAEIIRRAIGRGSMVSFWSMTKGTWDPRFEE